MVDDNIKYNDFLIVQRCKSYYNTKQSPRKFLKSCFPTWADILVLGVLSFTVGTLWGTEEDFNCQECIDQGKKKRRKKRSWSAKKKRHRQNSSSVRTLAIFLPQSRLSRGTSLWARHVLFHIMCKSPIRLFFLETVSDLIDSDNCPPSPLLGRCFLMSFACEYVCVFVCSPGDEPRSRTHMLPME